MTKTENDENIIKTEGDHSNMQRKYLGKLDLTKF